MIIIGQYRIAPLPGTDLEAFERTVNSIKLTPTRITRGLKSSLMKTTGEPVPTYVWSATVDSMTDKYKLPSATRIQDQIKDVGVITDFQAFEGIED